MNDMTEGERTATTAGEERLSTLLRFEAFFAQLSPAFVVLVGFLLVALIALVDHATGRLSVAVFYLFPVGLITFSRGRVLGGVTAFMVAIAIGVVDVAGGMTALDAPATFANVLIRFLGFLVFVLLIAMMRDVVLRERATTAKGVDAVGGLRAMNELKDTLLRAVSHDLKGPIAAIRGSATTLRRADQLKLTDEQRGDLLDAIAISASRSERLVNDLLDLERLDRGVVEPDRAPTDLHALVERVVLENTHVSAHPVRIDSPDSFLVSIDEGKVDRIVDNLLTNAAKHTPMGTPVVIRIERLGAGARITVEDEGPGVPDAIKETIFEAFRQGNDARAMGRGTGIGLSLVAKFADLHGGRAWVQDRPGGGAQFIVDLPGEVSSLPDAPQKPPAQQGEHRKAGADVDAEAYPRVS